MSKPNLQVIASDSVASKVQKIERFLYEHFFHPSGLMYSFWYWGPHDELRPFEPRDFDGASTFTLRAGTTMWDLHHFENSPYTAGVFLWSQCLRYQATKDDEALRYAAKAYRSLELTYRMAEERGEPGFMCKPHGLTFTRESSPDQYASFMPALWEYRKICDAPTRARIEQMIPAMSDWWRLRKYRLAYFDRPESSWLPDEEVCPSQYGPMFAEMHLMAHQITGRPESRDEAYRIIEWLGTFPWRHDVCRELMVRKGTCFWPEKLYGYEYDPSRRQYLHMDWENYSAIWYAATAAAWMIENHDDESLKRTLRHAMANYLRHSRQNLTDDFGNLYWSQTDLDTGKCYPLVRPRISTDVKDFLIGLNWNFFSYASKFYWNEQGQILTDIAMLAHHYAPGFSPGALSLYKTMMAKLDNERMHYMTDPDGKQLMASEKWMCRSLPSTMPLTPLAYWRARVWGIDMETQSA